MDRVELLAAELRSELGPAPAPSDAQWRRLQGDSRFASPQRSERRRWLGGAAIALAALFLWVVVAGVPFGARSQALSTAGAPLDRRLDDGSVLVLEHDSRGRLEQRSEATSFRLEAGKVRLDVAPQRGRTFEVLAGGYVVTVIGTGFDVSLGAGGSIVVEVAHGAVRVAPPHERPAVLLGAGDRLEGDARGVVSVKRVASGSSAQLGEASAPSVESPPEAAAPEPGSSGSEAPSASTAARSLPDWRALFQARRYSEALVAARALGLDTLQKELDAGALSDLADTARLAGDKTLSLRVLAALRARFPGTEPASRAAFLIGRAHALSGNAREAVKAFEAHLAEDPNGAHSVEALGRLMELYADLGDAARARSAAERYLQRAPRGPYERLARSLLAP